MVVNYWQFIKCKIEKLRVLPSKRSSLKSLRTLHPKLKCTKLTKILRMVSKKERNKARSQINKKTNLRKHKESKIIFQMKPLSSREKPIAKIISLKYVKDDNRINS